MPLVRSKNSSESRKVFEKGLQHLVELGRVPAGLPVHPDAQPVYVLNVKADGKPDLSTAKRVCLLYFAGSLDGYCATGEVTETSPPTVSNMRYGETARKLLNAYQHVEASPESRRKAFEVCLLRLPNALAEGYWLQPTGDEAGGGMILPFGDPVGRYRTTNRPIEIDPFLAALRPVEGAERVGVGRETGVPLKPKPAQKAKKAPRKK